MSTLTITRGLPASGKTTWARAQVDARPAGEVIRLNRDDLRASMLPTTYRRPVHTVEEIVTQVQHGQIVALLRAGVDVIVDDTNLRMRHARQFALLAKQADADFQCNDTFLEVPVEECLRRDTARPNLVGEDVINGLWQKYLSGGRTLGPVVVPDDVAGKPYIPVVDARPAVMVDIDGTVALHGDRDPYDTSRYHEDTTNWAVVQAVLQEWAAGNRIVFCSGRSEEFREVTTEWIRSKVFMDGRIGFDLFMRPEGDTRNDAIVKLELFDQNIRDNYNIRRVYDDRDRVVKAWRSIGLTVLQVAEGDF